MEMSGVIVLHMTNAVRSSAIEIHFFIAKRKLMQKTVGNKF